jgi:hypothetical protein
LRGLTDPLLMLLLWRLLHHLQLRLHVLLLLLLLLLRIGLEELRLRLLLIDRLLAHLLLLPLLLLHGLHELLRLPTCPCSAVSDLIDRRRAVPSLADQLHAHVSRVRRVHCGRNRRPEQGRWPGGNNHSDE